MIAVSDASCRRRRALRVRGTVQGVGFRPAISRFATRLGLGGFVRNEHGEVLIEVEGTAAALERFFDELTQQAPPLSRIDSIETASLAPLGEDTFEIVPSLARAPGAATLGAAIP